MNTPFIRIIALAAACALPFGAAAQSTARPKQSLPRSVPHTTAAPNTTAPGTPPPLGSVPPGNPTSPLSSVPSGNPTSPLSSVPSGNPTSPVSVPPGGPASPLGSAPSSIPSAASRAGPLDNLGGGAFRSLDANNDGFLSRDEAARAQLIGRFRELDVDGDGRLSQSELGATTVPVAASVTPGASGATAAPTLEPSSGR